MACCVEPNFSYEGDDEDGYSIAMTAASDDDSSEASGYSRRTVSHRPTPLFREIEQLNWEYVLLFLKTSKWANSFFTSSSTEHLAHSDAATQARTWVLDRDVRRLPIHLAVALNAPFVVLQKLLEIHPDSIRMRDSLGLLPLHIAYKTEVPDTVISTLLEAWPAASLEKNKEGRMPHEEPGDTARGKVLSLTLTQMAAQVKADRDKDWKQFLASEAESIDLEVTKDTTLMVVMKQLVEDRKQLLEIKSQLKTNFSAASSRGTRSSDNKSSSRSSKDSTPGRIESAFAKHMSRRGKKGRKGCMGGKKADDSKNDADLETIFSGATEPQKNPRSPNVL